MAKSIGKFISALRKANGYTQEQLAEILGVSNKTISSWENDNSCPDLTMIPILAEIFHVSCDEILTGQRIIKEAAVEENNTSNKIKRGIIKKQMNWYQSMVYISIAVFMISLIVMIPGGIFIKRIFGLVLFLLGISIYIGGIVFSLITYNGIKFMIQDEDIDSLWHRFLLRKSTFIKCLYSFFILSFIFCFLANREFKTQPKYNASLEEVKKLKQNTKFKWILFGIASFILLGLLAYMEGYKLLKKLPMISFMPIYIFLIYILLVFGFIVLYLLKRKKIY